MMRHKTQTVTQKIIGDKTHHQLQSITSVSLNTMNAMVSKPKKPMPPDDEEDFEFDITAT